MVEINSSTKFCHFTPLKFARNILKGEYFFLGKMSNMDDQEEAKTHKNEDNKLFSLCFCHSEALNIPLFYLYAGIDGKGCRIEFTAASIRELVKDVKLYYVDSRNHPLKRRIDPKRYKVYWNWIYYSSENGHYEYRDKEGYLSELRCPSEERRFFEKNAIWKFEKEFRIVVCFDEDVKYDRVAIKIPIEKIKKGILLRLGPETTDEEYESIRKEFTGYKIEKATEKLIRMGLVEKNKDVLRGK